ncbi:amphi-Trp domain-containing protein [Halocatena pleomorpha]|uniref:Amphi-Trp domain-containing protein n=1 Tax=Halocatena pleomorpha TaxID=1785090 RepID=A0A3P3R788_9EURY|nr:amphi-Trp domain-containing protein [Halocatena pleomorpha]RRJ28413.1 amphi-Trp domain-containing protein [Halocatena pleomorpha]
MSETTDFESELSRSEVAEYLHELANEFVDEEAPMTVPVGNKEVTLHPSPTVSCETSVTERSPMLGTDKEEVVVSLSWSPSNE